MNHEVIVTCAVTGAGDTVGRHPAIPVTPKQIAAAAIEAAKAGATVAHCHVRDPQTGKPSRDVALYRELVERIRESDTDVIINFTAGMGGDMVFGPGETPLPLDPAGPPGLDIFERRAAELAPEDASAAVRAGIAQAPVELENIARSLGRSPSQALWLITLRLAAPGAAAGAALVFLAISNELTATLLLSPSGTRTLATGFWAMTSEIDYAAAAPYALMMILSTFLSRLIPGVGVVIARAVTGALELERAAKRMPAVHAETVAVTPQATALPSAAAAALARAKARAAQRHKS